MNLTVPIAVSDRVKLIAKGITYLGPKVLHQFEVINNFSVTWPNQAQFSMTFRRLYDYNLISVYIPSNFLLCISLITNYSSIQHFEANIMVHLTTMLVMYTLLQAISVSLPQVRMKSQFLNCFKTANLKLNDYWLFFGISVPFFDEGTL